MLKHPGKQYPVPHDTTVNLPSADTSPHGVSIPVQISGVIFDKMQFEAVNGVNGVFLSAGSPVANSMRSQPSL